MGARSSPRFRPFTFTAQASFDGRNLASAVARTVQLTSDGGTALLFSVAQLDAQGPRFTVCGASARSYLIEASTNLFTWTAVQTITTDAAGQFLFRPPSPFTNGHRFFRARTP